MEIEKIYFGENCNTYIIGNRNNECVVIDPGYNHNDALIRHLKKCYKNVSAVLLTHGHFDHIEALNDIFKEYKPKIYMHECEIDKLYDFRLNCSSKENPIEFNDIKPILIKDNDILNLNGLNIKVIHTPFHTSGSVCYYFESLNSLFTGDTLFHLSIGRFDLPTASPRTIMSSLEKLKKLPENTKVYPGHDANTTIKNELEFNRYLKK